MEKFIGVIEENDSEGETFGYYFPDTPSTRAKLAELEVILDASCLIEYYIDWEPYTQEELRLISKGANNTYKDRVTLVTKQVDWTNIFKKIEEDEDPLYKGECFN